jgi:hypothetical protein
LPIAVLTGIYALICYALVYNKPDFPPTFSEEDKNSVLQKDKPNIFKIKEQI